MAHPLANKITSQTADLMAQGLLRQRTVATEADDIIDFSHNDYLGLATEPALAEALFEGAKRYGVGSKASPLVSGYTQAHFALEQRLCEITGHLACMLFCSGFSANSALMNTLFDQHDVVIADKLVHASIIDGIQQSQAKLVRFLHNDVASAANYLSKHPQCVVVTESIFSMDGDIAPLAELSALCQQHKSWLIVDDAHGFGVLPADVVNAQRVDIQVVTFGKALGCQGAAILASQQVIDFLVAKARHYIYSTALSPANAHVALAAVNLLHSEPERVQALHHNIAVFRQLACNKGIQLTPSNSAIQAVIIGDNATTMVIAEALLEHGFKVGAIRSPTVPKGQARLRITLNALHQAQHIDGLVTHLAAIIHRTNS